MKKASFILFLFLLGCSQTKLMYSKDGEDVFRTRCGGMFRDMTDCYSNAFSSCNGEFEIISSFDASKLQTTEINIDNSINVSVIPQRKSGTEAFMDGYNSQKKFERYMIYKCKKK